MDSDGDGLTDGQEYWGGSTTQPLSSATIFQQAAQESLSRYAMSLMAYLQGKYISQAG